MRSGLTIEEQVLELVRNEIGSGYEINLDTVILNASGINEERQRELVMRLEEELEVEIPDKDAEGLHTVKDIVDYIVDKTKASGEE